MFVRILRHIALRYGKLGKIWAATGVTGEEWTGYMMRWGGLHSIGSDCSIVPGTKFLDPDYVSIGNNVHFSACAIIGHDGSTPMLNRAFGVSLEGVGKVVFEDNIFVGYGAIVMPGVTVQANSIIAAGAVVSKDVPAGFVVAGVPARPIKKVSELVADRVEATDRLPWGDLIRRRGVRGFDPTIEPALRKARVQYFFGSSV